jgi:hypothetical protein
MPRYFFDHHNGAVARDDTGILFADSEAAINEAMASLPMIAAETIRAADNHCHNIAVVVREEDGSPIYSAALSYCGTRL